MLSAPIVITPPTGEVLALDAVKTFLRVDGPDLDVEIEGYVAAAIVEVEQLTGVRLAPQVVEVRADRFEDLEHLHVGPATGVASITYRDFAGVVLTVDPDDYELVAADLSAGIFASFALHWPDAPHTGGAIKVQLEVGYAEVPADLRLALLLSIRAKFDGTPCDLFSLTVNRQIHA
ncbi:MAG TPA: hypothetical protein VF503_01325 [Sphingobium sp.]|uniref:head-tail connector protein n=1 Tax=Sphingobium sp. TaxID=1912891 RepID=UPI002ED120A8